MNNEINNLPTYASLMIGTRQPRGYPNLMAIHRDAMVSLSTGTVSARIYYEQVVEKPMRLMTVAERGALIQFLNPDALQRYPIEFPFRMPPTPGIGQNAIEIFYSRFRYIMYIEFADDVGLQKLIRYQQIPMDPTDPMHHIKTRLHEPTRL
jgi:hypothetical protein